MSEPAAPGDPGGPDAKPSRPYEPPAIAWEEPFEPVAFADSFPPLETGGDPLCT